MSPRHYSDHVLGNSVTASILTILIFRSQNTSLTEQLTRATSGSQHEMDTIKAQVAQRTATIQQLQAQLQTVQADAAAAGNQLEAVSTLLSSTTLM